MKEARKAKKHSNQYWFKATREGKELTPRKDRPFEVQEYEKNRRWQNRADRNQVQVEIDLPREENKEENRKEEDSTEGLNKKEVKVKEVEAVLFVPSTPNSTLRKMVQKAKDQAARMMNSPSIRVVERSGTKLIEEIGDNNPWKKEWTCPRKDCLPCEGLLLLGAEAEEEALRQVCGEEIG